MALNKYMHPRNVYKTRKPDFKQLSLKYDYFREKVTQNLNGKVILEFKDPASLRALTRALLEDDFGLLVSLPVDRLIPTVPQRLNYILWLEDIIGPNTQARGVDIGTGSSCIYPLLGCKKNGWEFLASDIDDQNILFATQNVERNDMQDKIKIKKVEEDQLLLGVVEESYDFCMCNPPFFTDHLEAQGISSTRNDDRPDPKSVSTASQGESIAWGGEVRFVCQMIEESLILKDKIRVYTSMLGKKMSLSLIKDQLIKKKITNFSSTEFCQGRTMRWAVAWTFNETLQFPKSSFKELKKPTVSCTFEVPRGGKAVTDYTVQAFTDFVRSEMVELKMNYHVKHSGKFYTYIILQPKHNTWSHQRRKRRKEKFATINTTLQDNNTETVTSTQLNSSTQCNGTESKDSNSTQVDSSHDNKTNSKDCLNMGDNNGSNKTNLINDVKELKNMKNLITKGQDSMITDSNVANDLCLKRKWEGSSGAKFDKRLKTDNNEVNNEVNKVSTSDRDSGANIAHPSNSGDNQAKQELSDSSDAVELAINGKHATLTDQHETMNRSENLQVTNEEQVKQNTETSDSDKHDDLVEKLNVRTGNKLGVSVTEGEDTEMLDTSNTGDTIDIVKGSVSNEAGKPNTPEVDSNQLKSRDEIIKQFWKEQNANQHKDGSKKRVPHSEYERMESLDETEECLSLMKLMIRKDEGTVTFSLTHMAGQKEAVHQIMQYFRNKLA